MRTALPSLLLALLFTGCTLVPDVTYRADVEGELPGWSGDTFMRYNGYDNVAGTMQVSASDYVSADGKHTITLVGAVHIADAGYYAEVQKLLDGAERVYYELVKPEGMSYPPPGLQEADGMYSGMADLFGLSEQMLEVDYERDHFVWLDMSQEEFSQRLTAIVTKAAARLGNLFGAGVIENPVASFRDALLAARPELRIAFARTLMGVNMKVAPTDPIAMLMELVYLPLSMEKAYYRSTKGEKAFEDKYKHNMSVGLRDPQQALDQVPLEELQGDALSGILMDALAEFQAVILEERNQIVIDGLLAALASGDAPAHIAVWYGAAHNAGIAQGLLDAGLVKGEKQQWLSAIDIQP